MRIFDLRQVCETPTDFLNPLLVLLTSVLLAQYSMVIRSMLGARKGCMIGGAIGHKASLGSRCEI